MTTDDLDEPAIAGNLFDTLDNLDTGIKGLRRDVRDEVRARTRALRWIVAVGGLVVALALIFAVVAWVQNGRIHREIDAREKDRINSSVIACQNGNATREAIEDRFSSFIDVLAGLGTPPATPAEEEARKAIVDKIRKDFADSLPPPLGPRDCSVESVTDPAAVGS